MGKSSPILCMLKYVTLRALNALSAAREHVVEIRTQLGVL